MIKNLHSVYRGTRFLFYSLYIKVSATWDQSIQHCRLQLFTLLEPSNFSRLRKTEISGCEVQSFLTNFVKCWIINSTQQCMNGTKSWLQHSTSSGLNIMSVLKVLYFHTAAPSSIYNLQKNTILVPKSSGCDLSSCYEFA